VAARLFGRRAEGTVLALLAQDLEGAPRSPAIFSAQARLHQGTPPASHPSAELEETSPEGESGVPGHTPLPVPLTSLLGREREVAVVAALLRQPSVRLVTLTGTGGVGKARLALHVAAAISDTFADGICFVSLAPISDAGQVMPAIAKALDLWEALDRPVLDHVHDRKGAGSRCIRAYAAEVRHKFERLTRPHTDIPRTEGRLGEGSVGRVRVLCLLGTHRCGWV
jgi:hypothetical protein